MSFFGSIDALQRPGGVTRECRFSIGDIGGIAGPTLPVLIDSSQYAPGFGSDGGDYGQPIIFGGALYQMLWGNATDHLIKAYKSTDSGATWSLLDSANSPTDNGIPPRWYLDSGSGTVYVAYRASSSSSDTWRFRNFDLNTGTWGSDYGTSGGPNHGKGLQLFLRTDNTLLLVGGSGGNNTSPTDSTVFAIPYDITGAAWGSEFDPGTGWTGLSHYGDAGKTYSVGSTTSGYVDASGNVGVFFGIASNYVTSPNIWDGRYFYVQISLSNAVVTTYDFPGQNTLPQDIDYRPQFGGVVLLEGTPDTIMLTVNRRDPDTGNLYPGYWLGTPVSSPTWTENPGGGGNGAQGLDADATWNGALQPNSIVCGAYDGTTVVFLWITPDPAGIVFGARIRRSANSNTTNLTSPWTAGTIFDMTQSAPAGFYPLTGATQSMSFPAVGTGTATPPPPAASFPNIVHIPGGV